MNERIKDILVGSILGDGHLSDFESLSYKSCLLLKTDNKSLSYLKWMHKELQPLGVSELKPKKNYHQHYFRTRWSREIGKLRGLFYSQGIKIIPRNIDKLLVRPLSLAVWYQDDGTLDCRSKYHYNALFATHCFSFQECVLLAETLKRNFDLDVSVARSLMRGKVRYRLYVRSGSMKRFIELVKPFINPSFSYKIRSNNSQQQR
jgi:hypothetical protein